MTHLSEYLFARNYSIWISKHLRHFENDTHAAVNWDKQNYMSLFISNRVFFIIWSNFILLLFLLTIIYWKSIVNSFISKYLVRLIFSDILKIFDPGTLHNPLKISFVILFPNIYLTSFLKTNHISKYYLPGLMIFNGNI